MSNPQAETVGATPTNLVLMIGVKDSADKVVALALDSDARLPVVTELASILGAGTGLIRVVDLGLSIVGSGNQTAGASAVVGTVTGAGYLTVVNTEAAGGKTMYIGATPAAGTSYPLPPGASDTARYAAVESVYVFGTGGTLGWIVRR